MDEDSDADTTSHLDSISHAYTTPNRHIYIHAHSDVDSNCEFHSLVDVHT